MLDQIKIAAPDIVASMASLEPILIEAGKIALSARKSLKMDFKPDGSIVTNGDKQVEKYLRDALPPLAPGASFWGEEGIFESPVNEGYWLVDPIDGTSNFAYGSQLWGISIAFYHSKELRFGGVYLPDLNENFVAGQGKGAYLNGKQLPTLEPGEIANHELVATTETTLRKLPIDRFPGKPRLSGAFVINGTYVATGRYRAVLAAREKLYDVAACVVIAREVGADVRYLDGEPFDESVHVFDQSVARLWGILPPDCNVKLEI